MDKNQERNSGRKTLRTTALESDASQYSIIWAVAYC